MPTRSWTALASTASARRCSWTCSRIRETGDTFLLLRVIVHPERGLISTTHWLFGAIPTTDFVIDSDLRLATLNTTINTSDGQFDNANIGPIVDLAISLTRTPDSWGQRVVTWRFFERIPETTIGHWETYRQNGPRAFGPMTGTFGDAEIEWYGELNRNRSVLIYRDVHAP
jgi:hypothetical protein